MSEQKQKLVLKQYPSTVPPPPEVTFTQQFRGPLGIWPWPLINLLLALIAQIRSLQTPAVTAERPPLRKVYSIVRDEKGRIVEVSVIEM